MLAKTCDSKCIGNEPRKVLLGEERKKVNKIDSVQHGSYPHSSICTYGYQL